MNRPGTIDKILQLKERKEEEIEHEVFDLRDEVSTHETKLGSLENAYRNTLETFHRKLGDGSLAPYEMGIFYSYFSHLTTEMETNKSRIARALTALEVKQGALVEAHKETRVVESLKERRSREQAKEESRRERKEMDFLSSTKRTDG